MSLKFCSKILVPGFRLEKFDRIFCQNPVKKLLKHTRNSEFAKKLGIYIPKSCLT